MRADQRRVRRPFARALLAASPSSRLALWSSLSFAGFAVSNALVFADLAILQTGELAIARAATACAGGALLLGGLIWETE